MREIGSMIKNMAKALIFINFMENVIQEVGKII